MMDWTMKVRELEKEGSQATELGVEGQCAQHQYEDEQGVESKGGHDVKWR